MGHDPHSLMFLAVSVVALLLGPGIHRVAEREPLTMAALDNFVLITIVGLVALEIVPGALELAGLSALLALLVGLLGPVLADGPLHRAAAGTHRTALVLAVLGMALHSFTDGLALASAHVAGGRSHALEIAVLAHQLPVAVAVWWLLAPAGPRRAAVAMLLLGLATVLGFLLADHSLTALAPSWLGLLQGLFAGLLLHVVAHRTHAAGPDRRAHVAASLGGLAGLGLLVLLVDDAGHAHDADPLAHVLDALGGLARASAPALLLGLLLVGLLATWAPAPRSRAERGTLVAAARGVGLGLLRPVRAHERLAEFRARTPASARLAYIVAGPALGVDALLLSLPLLGGGLTVARGLGAVVLGLVAGRLAGGLADRDEHRHDEHHADHPHHDVPSVRSPVGRMLAAIDAALPWLALGLLFAAMLAPWLSPGALTEIPGWVQIPVVAALGVPAHLCAAGLTPVVAVLLAAGLSPGAGLAFLLTGPAISVASQSLLGRLHGRRVARMNLALVLGLAVALGFAVDLVLAPSIPQLTGDASAQPGLASDLPVAALLAVLLVSLLRQTPQQFLRRLWAAGPDHQDHHHPDGGHHGSQARHADRGAHFSSRGPRGP